MEDKKTYLLERLKQENCLWSYDVDAISRIPDDLLIELVLIHLDLEEINLLFEIFPYQKIKTAWLEQVVAQGERYFTLNKFLAWYYFKMKRPGAYVRAMETKILNKRLAI